jgi:hypothetical protein
MLETVKAHPVGALVMLAVLAGIGAVLYIWTTDPLNQTCREVNADPYGFGIRAADAIYDSISDRARARTTREVTRMHVVSFCSVNDEKKVLSDMRDGIDRDAEAPTPAPVPAP